MKTTFRVGLCLAAFMVSTAAALRDFVPERTPGERIEAAARVMVASLDKAQRDKALLRFDDAYRTDWHYVPRARRGVRVDALSDAQKQAAHALLRATLSGQGYLKVTSIMDLEGTLRDLEKAAGGDGASRDPGAYTYTFFGTPGERPWAWRFEGHHVSLNILVAVDGSVAVTPAFLGSNPAIVPSGDKAGLEVLDDEEEIAFQLLHALTDVQRAEAVIGQAGIRDILLSPGKTLADLGTPRGLPASSMDDEQLRMFGDLVGVFAHNFEHALASEQLARLGEADPTDVYFAWVGGLEPGQLHYYRIQGTDWAIELDNTQGGNHVHTVWRDAKNDFGAAALVQHLREEHGD